MKTKEHWKKKIFVLAALLIIVFVAGCASETPLTGQVIGAEQKEPIKIGMMLPLTGDAASWGNEVKKGAELAYDELKNEKINSREIEVIYEDDKCSGRDGVTAITKLITVDNIKISGGSVCSSVAMSIVPILEANKVIHLSAAASNPVLTDAGDYIFRIWPSDSFEAQVIADLALEQFNAETAAVLYINNDYGVGVKDAFIERYSENKGEIRAVESFEVNANDFKTQLMKVKTANPDAVFIISNPSEALGLVKQLRELEINCTVFVNGPVIESEGFLQKAGTLAEGVIYAVPNMPLSEEYALNYKSKFGSEPGFLSTLGYDNIMLLFNAIKYCNGDNPDCVKEYLYTVKDYPGASGNITFDENGDVIKDFVIKTVKDGKAVNLN